MGAQEHSVPDAEVKRVQETLLPFVVSFDNGDVTVQRQICEALNHPAGLRPRNQLCASAAESTSIPVLTAEAIRKETTGPQPAD